MTDVINFPKALSMLLIDHMRLTAVTDVNICHVKELISETKMQFMVMYPKCA
jgi:hypothetical protein